MEAPHIGAKTKGSSKEWPCGKSDGSGSDNGCDSDSDDSSSDEDSRSASPPTAAIRCDPAALALYTQLPSPVAIPPNSISLISLHSLLSSDECATLIELGGGNFERSTVGFTAADVHSSSGRTSYDAFLGRRHPTVSRVRARVAELVGVRDSQIEELTVVRYESGQEYQPHYDSSGDSSRPRSHTIFAYLNDLPDGAGGETEFTRIGVKFKPKKGDALLWENRADRHSFHLDGKHAGRPPLRGVKYGE
jgi:prolyl 4-hydroxylase